MYCKIDPSLFAVQFQKSHYRITVYNGGPKYLTKLEISCGIILVKYLYIDNVVFANCVIHRL